MISNGFDDWRDAEKYLNESFGGSTQKSFNTSMGGRRIDNLTSSGIAQESKVGYNSLTDSVKTQALKDAELLNSVDEVTSVEWHFFKSGTTGKIGPSGPLKSYLESLGIKVIIH